MLIMSCCRRHGDNDQNLRQKAENQHLVRSSSDLLPDLDRGLPPARTTIDNVRIIPGWDTTSRAPTLTVALFCCGSHRRYVVRTQASRATADVVAPSVCPDLEAMPTWPVPEHIQKQPSFPVTDNDYVKMLGFEEVFPGYTGQALAEAWDTDATFRWADVFVVNGDAYITFR